MFIMDEDDGPKVPKMVQTQQDYKELIETSVHYVSAFMEVKSITKYSEMDENLDIKDLIPEGKDLLLANLTDNYDQEEYMKRCKLLVSLLMEQKRHFMNQETHQMLKGLIPAVEATSLKLNYFVIGTRAKGPQRERALHVQSLIKGLTEKMNGKVSATDGMFGPK
jgi:hypothetical protein